MGLAGFQTLSSGSRDRVLPCHVELKAGKALEVEVSWFPATGWEPGEITLNPFSGQAYPQKCLWPNRCVHSYSRLSLLERKP